MNSSDITKKQSWVEYTREINQIDKLIELYQSCFFGETSLVDYQALKDFCSWNLINQIVL